MPASNRLAEVVFSNYDHSNWFPYYHTTPDDETISTIIDLIEVVINSS